MPKHAVDKQTNKDRQTNYVEREWGRKNYFVHNMRQDVAIILYKNKTMATKPVGRHRRTRDRCARVRVPADVARQHAGVRHAAQHVYTCTRVL